MVYMAPLCNKLSGLKSAKEISMSISLRKGEYQGDNPEFLDTPKISNIHQGCPAVIMWVESRNLKTEGQQP